MGHKLLLELVDRLDSFLPHLGGGGRVLVQGTQGHLATEFSDVILDAVVLGPQEQPRRIRRILQETPIDSI